MLTVEKVKDYLSITFAYCPMYVSRIKDIESSVFNDKTNAWLIDIEDLPTLEDIFKGELYFKTPKWKITGDIPPILEFKLKKEFPLPKLRKGIVPYPYQSFGYQFIMNRLYEHSFCMLCDDVGLGS